MGSLPTWTVEGDDGAEEREVLPYGEGLGYELTGLLPSLEHCNACGWRGPYDELAEHDKCGECGAEHQMTTVYGFDEADMRFGYEFDVEWVAQQLVYAINRLQRCQVSAEMACENPCGECGPCELAHERQGKTDGG